MSRFLPVQVGDKGKKRIPGRQGGRSGQPPTSVLRLEEWDAYCILDGLEGGFFFPSEGERVRQVRVRWCWAITHKHTLLDICYSGWMVTSLEIQGELCCTSLGRPRIDVRCLLSERPTTLATGTSRWMSGQRSNYVLQYGLEIRTGSTEPTMCCLLQNLFLETGAVRGATLVCVRGRLWYVE